MSPPHHDTAIVGSGFGGLGMAIELRRSGRDDFVILEREEGLGGTWRANSYPGCACDVPAPYYSFSFAPKPDWSRLYAPHHEIRDYLEDCADRFGVRSRIRFGSEVTAADWDEAAQRWRIEVGGEPALTARNLVAAPGPLARPAYPEIDGIGEFAGPWFHSSEWDHDVDLEGARVAVIGTGASAIQIVPQIAPKAAHVDVYQRTAPWVLPKPDRPIPRALQELFRRVPLTQRGLRGTIWALQEWMGLGNTVSRAFTRPLEVRGRRAIAAAISDPELRRKVTPDFAIGCKRVLLANDWYPALARDDVGLVTDGIERITADGLRAADGAERPADVIVFSTGFHATDPLGSLRIKGRAGAELTETWRDGMEAHRGTTIAGFPNFFIIPGPNTGTGHTSQVFMIEAQIRYVLAALRRMDERGAAAVEPTLAAQTEWNAKLQRRMKGTVWVAGGCTSWYLDANGKNTTLWPSTSLSFRRALASIDDGEHRFEPALREPSTTSTAAVASATAPAATAASTSTKGDAR